MRATFVSITAATLAWTTSLAAAVEFPYTAYIQVDLAPVKSGPGPNYYATDGLLRGSQVEVYRHDRAGWCAIRPPTGSFSWVERGKLRSSGQPNVAKVVAKDALSYVGTRFGDDHDVHHVHLRPGEWVEVLQTAPLAGRPGRPGRLWAKIAPPAGEFRWIHSKYIADHPPAPTLAEPQPDQDADDDLPDEGWATEATEATAEDVEQLLRLDDPPEGTIALESDVVLASHQSDVNDTPVTGGPSAPTAASSGASDDPWTATDSATDHAGPGALAFRDTTPDRETQGLAASELDAVDVQLSLEVSRDPLTWNLEGLQSRVQAVIDSCADALQRERARRLLGTIVQFQDLRRRHERLRGTGTEAAGLAFRSGAYPPSDIAGRSLPLGAAPELGRPAGSRAPYDGVGWLMPVITQRSSVPRYALTDRNGHILQFVTPAPGVNLRRFQRQQVGVIGRRGYVPRLRTPHLMADRVVVLNRHRR